MAYWLVKSEPFKYSWEQFVSDQLAVWDGVRNYQARNNLREMKTGDEVFFYHSNEGLAIVGMARVVKEAYQDPTTDNTNWVVVELAPEKPFRQPVTLAQMKADARLEQLGLIRQGRLSVCSVSAGEWAVIMELGGMNESTIG